MPGVPRCSATTRSDPRYAQGMRAIWKGAVSFGLVSVPVKLYAATESHDVSFRQVHAKDGGRIKYQRICSIDGEEVPYADIAKGYETEDGEMVILSDDDLAELPMTSSREIAVEKFVPTDQIDPMLLEKSYYLEPEKTGAKPYALLRQALLDADRMAVVTVALRQRTTIAVLRVKDDVIVLQTMMWPDEIRTPDFSVETGEVKDAEVKMATMLVETLAGDFDASEFEDDYAGAVEAMVKAKIEGGEIKRTPTSTKSSGEVVDLLAALQRSVDAAKTARGEDTGSDSRTPAPARTPARTPAPRRRPRRPPRRRPPAARARRRRRPRRPPPRRPPPRRAPPRSRRRARPAEARLATTAHRGELMTSTLSGAPTWVELVTRDTEEAIAFYGGLFGWSAEVSGPEYGGYITFQHDGVPVAGCMSLEEPDVPSSWSVYLASDDAAATAASVREHGGQVYVEPMKIGDMGHMAFGADPSGAAVGIWQNTEPTGLGERRDPGSPVWFELHSNAYAQAVDFYRDVFGWDTETMSDTASFRYTTLGHGDDAVAGILDDGSGPSYWTFYVAVADTDQTAATAVSLGGGVDEAAQDSPFGRMARLVDPAGLSFMVLGPNTAA